MTRRLARRHNPRNPFAAPGILFETEGDGGGGGTGDGGDSKDKGGSDFQPIASQADLDRVVGARLAREREKFADYADLKRKAEAHDKALEAAKTESEKAIDAARKEGESAATERANARLVSAEARALAAEAKFRNPAFVVRALDLKDVTVNDAGEVDAAAIKAKLKEVSDADPLLLDDGKGARPKPDGAQGGGGGRETPSVSRGREMFAETHPKKTT